MAMNGLHNLIATLDGAKEAPSVMLFTHMDQLGFVVRKIEANGLVRIERLGGVPEKALPSQAVLFCVGEGRDVPGIIANKSHPATTQDEKYRDLPYPERYVDAGFADGGDARHRDRCGDADRLSAARSSARRRSHRRNLRRRSRRLRRHGRGRAP
jgi:putative aminopeptidase FrvX